METMVFSCFRPIAVNFVRGNRVIHGVRFPPAT
jgi:hypothetical protein